jgi:hypothetical protein
MPQSRRTAVSRRSRSGTYRSINPRMPDIKMMIQHAVQSFLPPGVAAADDVDRVTRICVMAAVPTGEEDPHELLRGMSDNLINAFATNLAALQKNPVSGPVAQLFFMEWCWRHGHLHDDWKWKWDTTNEGHVSYNSKEPLDKLLRARTAC